MRRHTLRTYTGKYKRKRFYNKKENRKTWFEVMCLAVLAIWGGVAADLHPIAEAYYSLPDKIEITRESKGNTSSSGGAADNTGGTVTAVPLADSSNDGGVVTPKSEPRPTPSDESIEEKILKAWEGTGEGQIALAIAKSESGLNPNAKGDISLEYEYEGKTIGHSCGIFQIRVLPSRPDCETLKDVDKNIEFARKLYDRSGFLPWSMFKNKAYLKYL